MVHVMVNAQMGGSLYEREKSTVSSPQSSLLDLPSGRLDPVCLQRGRQQRSNVLGKSGRIRAGKRRSTDGAWLQAGLNIIPDHLKYL